MSKKVVLRLEVHGDKEKQKAMKAVSGLPGIESLAMDMKDRKLTVIGDVDPVDVVCKLRKSWCAEILTVGPAKEPEKKDDEKKKEEEKKKKEAEQMAELLKKCKNCNPCCNPCCNPSCPQYYPVCSVEENPSACVIC